MKLILIFSFICFFSSVQGESRPVLRENIARANPGDFVVTTQGKTFTVLHIKEKTLTGFILEEITAPGDRIPQKQYSWREWVENEAPGHTSWVMYQLNTNDGSIEGSFSYTKNCWFKIKDADNFLSTLLSMDFHNVPRSERKRIGPSGGPLGGRESRPLWQPRMIVNGQIIDNVLFTAWKARWPKDGSDLADKIIEVYIPEESDRYPSYFPYWLQVSGWIGKAKVRVIESGGGLLSPKSTP